jgi:thiamine-monophosphate kinase
MSAEDAPETLAGAGEFAIIERLVAGHAQPAAVLLGPGDDAAVVRAAGGRVVVSTDMLVEDRHFRLDWSTPHDVGRKAIAQNAADIEAMGAVPTAFVVAFGAPGDTAAADVGALSEGMWAEASAIGCGIAGGDLVHAPQWVISVTALGELDADPVLLGGAMPGDVVAIVGDLGRSAAGYALLLEDVRRFDELRRRHRVPTPPYGAGRDAAAAGATAMTDVSDGLLADLGHVARASHVGIDLSSAGLAPDRDAVGPAAETLGVNPLSWVLAGGEDHALVATFPGALPEGWRPIGRVADGPADVLVDGERWHGDTGWVSY